MVADLEHVLIIRFPRIDGKRAVQNKVVISTLAVAMPRNGLARRQSEDACLHILSDYDRLYIFDGIIRFC